MPGHRAETRQAAASPARGGTIRAVDHAIELLRCLSEADEAMGVNDIARRVGLHKSSVSRLAATLERARLLQRDPLTGRLSLGIGLVTLAAPVLAGLKVTEIVRPVLLRLAAATGETVSFSIWDGREAVSIEQAPGSNSIRAFSRPGHRDPGHATAAGKVLLAHQDDAAVEAYCAKPLRRFTDATIADAASLKAELTRCRADRVAMNAGELESDVGAVSAVVFDERSRPLGAITVAVPMYRFEPARRARLADEVRQCATELSAKLGYPPALGGGAEWPQASAPRGGAPLRRGSPG